MLNKHVRYYLAGSVAFLTFLVYLFNLDNDFVRWDDGKYVYDNPFIRSVDPAFFKWAFTDINYGRDWIPLTWISHAIDYAIWGADPLGHHLTSNILHALNTFLVVLLVIRLIFAAGETGSSGFSANHAEMKALIAAAVTGLLFGIHPIHVESVAWVSERRDVLYAPFFILSLMMYERYVMSGVAGRNAASRFLSREYLLSVGLFLLSLMSKPMAVSLPVVLLILDWYPFQRIRSLRSFRSALFEKIPFIALALFSSVITVLAKKIETVSVDNIGLMARFLVAGKSLVMYLWKMVYPYQLNPLYSFPKNVSISSFEYLLPLLLVATMSIVFVVIAKRKKLWLAIWAFYVITLLPVLGIVKVGYQAMADRYTYIPGIGPFLVAGLLTSVLITGTNKFFRWRTALKTFIPLIMMAILCLMLSLTVKQIKIWNNTFSLFNHVIEISSEKFYLPYQIRGVMFKESGEFDRAIEDFNEAILLNPSDMDSYNYRAQVFSATGQLEKAIADFTVSINARPTPEAYYERGIAFSKKGETDKAIKDFTNAVTMNPRDFEAYTRLGILYGRNGSLSRAVESFDIAIELNPDYHFTYGNRGHAYLLMGDHEKALEDFNKALDLNKNYTRAYVNRGNLYLTTGRRELALEDFQKACSLGEKEACAAYSTL
jgi:lipoprotein NlpI